MKEWSTMTLEERKAARDGWGRFERRVKMDGTLENVLGLLAGDERATEEAWKLPWGKLPGEHRRGDRGLLQSPCTPHLMCQRQR